MKFSDLGALFDGPHATPQRIEEGPYFLNISSLSRGRLDLSQSDHISQDQFERWTRRVEPQAGDLLFSYETRLGEAALMPSGIRACLGRRMALLRPDRSVVNPRFLLYWYVGPTMQQEIEQRTVLGATVPRILLSEMPHWPVEVPPLAEQEAIAEVLGALDDKIAANNTIAWTSDALVRAMYDALPSADAKAPLQLGSFCSNARQQADPTSAVGIYLGLEHIPRREMWISEFGDASEVSSAKSSFEPGDVLFGKLRPYFHKVASAPTVGICSTDILVLRASDPALQGYVLAAAASDAVVATCVATSAGTRMPRASWADLSACEVRWPGKPAAYAFSAQVEAIRDAVAAANRESRTLAELRDTLLPVLMDGTIRVKDAVAQAEGVL